MGEIRKLTDDDYNATCYFCGSTSDIQMWPWRTEGRVTGFMFACAKCQDKAPGCKITALHDPDPEGK